MNLIPMLAWWQWLIMAAIPPLIVLLYFLKLRRLPVQVPSTYLWKKTIEDLHVNSIWQKLRKNLLLLLQLVAIALLILACLRPGSRGQQSLGDRTVFLIDNSSSMQATDVKPTRLDEAKRKAIELIDGLEGNDAAMVIAFSDRADVRISFSKDRRRLREAIESIRPTNRTTDLNEALRAAAGLANPGRTSQIEDVADVQVAEALPAKLYILSDGGFAAPQIDLGNLSPEYLPIGSENANNVGVLAFTVERNSEKPNQVEAFARIRNFSDAELTLNASLSMDGQLLDAAEVKLEPQGENGASFSVENSSEGQLKLELDVVDDLRIDNVAFAGLDPPRQLEVVVVSEGNTALETALATAPAQAIATIRIVGPAQLEEAELQSLGDSGKVDLFIYDQCAPKKLPRANTLFIGSLPPGDAWSASDATGPLFVIDLNRAHPIMQYVDMGTVRIVEGQALKSPAGAVELARTTEGVLMAVAPREAYQDAVLAMGLMKAGPSGGVPNTDWPIKRSFPVFLLNCLEYLGGAVSTSGARNFQPGQSAVLSLASRFEKVRITRPDGSETTIGRDGQPQITFTQTDDPGIYRARQPEADRLLQLFTVNLFSERESSIKPAADVRLGEERIEASGQKEATRREYWRWMLAIALLVLTAEWFLYIRRIAV